MKDEILDIAHINFFWNFAAIARSPRSSAASVFRPGTVQPSRSKLIDVMRLVLEFVLIPLVPSTSSEAQKPTTSESNAPTIDRGIQQICLIWTHFGTASQITFQVYRIRYLE